MGPPAARGEHNGVRSVSDGRELGEKRAAYRAGRVPEIWLVDTDAQVVDLDHLAGERYETTRVANGWAASRILAGFRLDVAWLRSEAPPDTLACLEAMSNGADGTGRPTQAASRRAFANRAPPDSNPRMKFALIGPPYSGKSTLFTAISGLPPDPASAGIARHASVRVPDARLDYLASLYKPKKYTEAIVDFVDVPGISLADAHGQAEFRHNVAELRLCAGLVAVVRAFASDAVPGYRNRVDPKADLEELHTELIFSDLEQVTKRIDKLEAQLRKGSRTADADKRELAFFSRIREALEKESPIRSVVHSDEETRLVSSFGFLTLLPMVVVINVSEGDINEPPPFQHEHAQATIVLSAEIEAEIAQLDPADRPAFMADLGISESARTKLIRACYHAAGLHSFLTAGPDEVRAWTIHKGATAVEAAARIHTDIARGFIKAETIAFEDLKAQGDLKAARAHGKVRLEGKQYEVRDGDLIEFKFNV